ncbi:MAG: glutamate-5-semialdehyde dehydrogenase [Anaerolineae bacterium]|nr:glutamate-5-semialdehyde dehydrogenase [Anaerolineae bacterium]
MNLMQMGDEARSASRQLAGSPTRQRNGFLLKLASNLINDQRTILTANQMDIRIARETGLTEALIDRLLITPERLNSMAGDVSAVAKLPDPVGKRFARQKMENGLLVEKMRVPLGVLAVIYESRPNVTIDVASLAVKSGNAVILRGGRETIHTNQALVNLVQQSLVENGLPGSCVQFINSPDRKCVMDLLGMADTIDMLIPRGGAALHQFCRENSRIPVITGGIGICHLFVDESADLDASIRLIHNAKTQRPSVCNALDTVLVHQAVAAELLPRMVRVLAKSGVTFRADPIAMAILQDSDAKVFPADDVDFDTEWLSLTLGVKVVEGFAEAIDHIATHSTGHSDGILTGNTDNADRFVRMVDSAAVYVNASTRFTDGSQLGLGAEVAISTQRLHARGPMALEELTIYKWVIRGQYHIRD